MGSVRRTAASLLWLSLLASTLAAQAQDPRDLSVYAYTLKHRRAADAVTLVSALLSPRGTVELQPGTNTLVVRDTLASISKIVPVLRSYDHPARQLSVELYLVRASRAAVSPPVLRSDLPPEMTEGLRQVLPYEIYQLVARTQIAVWEGQAVTFLAGGEYEVKFRVGTVTGRQQIRLSEFRISRRVEGGGGSNRLLLNSILNPRLEQPTFVGLASDANNGAALLLALTVRAGEPRRSPP